MLTILILLLFWLAPCTESAVQIGSIETQAGYAVLQGEPLNIIENFSELVHLIDVNDIRDTIQKLRLSTSNNFKIDDSWHLISRNKKINELEQSVQTLRIHAGSRNKRALINAGGRLINWLFGNMDDEDRLRIADHFKDIDLNQRNVINGLNKQVKRNNEMQSYLQNIRLVVEQNKKWFNKTYTGVVDESLRMTK